MKLSLLCDGLYKYGDVVLEDKINPSDIYNFYAIIGSLPRNEWKHFAWLFKQIYKNLMEESWRAIQSRVLNSVIDYIVRWDDNAAIALVDLEHWKSNGGSPKVWREVREILNPFLHNKIIDGKTLLMYSNEDAAKNLLDQKMRILTSDELESLFNLIPKTSWTLSTDGRWYKNKQLLDKIRDSEPRLITDIAHAVDLMIQMLHHNASFLEHTTSNYRDALKAVNAKFNASDPSQYWMYVDDYIKPMINKIRRAIGIPIILQSKVDRPKLFAPARRTNKYELIDIDDDINPDVNSSINVIRNLVDKFMNNEIDTKTLEQELDKMTDDPILHGLGEGDPRSIARRLIHKAKFGD
ncbi:MAG: hypothetical protein M0R50_06025 [Candidatus Cloacimonetes bacterium]|jgi:hypothetical protein|nr:hypothetical protein [Candidatus Cloacimonadota bacterium]